MPPFRSLETEGDTQQRLLDAAALEFARHGYTAARIRDIVEGAGVNLAAVNYHFGGKDGLYQATLAHLARKVRESSPIDSPELRAMPPEDQFRAFVRVMLMRYLGAAQASPLSRIVAHELLDPTPAFRQVVEGVTRPQFGRLAEIVRDLLGPRATEEDVSLASLSSAAQWTFFLFGRRLYEAQFPALAATPALVDKLTDHIVASCLAAMRATRARLEGDHGGHHRARRAASRSLKGDRAEGEIRLAPVRKQALED